MLTALSCLEGSTEFLKFMITGRACSRSCQHQHGLCRLQHLSVLIQGVCMLQNASEFQTWKSRPQLIHMQYAMLNEASGASDTSRIAKWQSIVVSPTCPNARLPVEVKPCAHRATERLPCILAGGDMGFSQVVPRQAPELPLRSAHPYSDL